MLALPWRTAEAAEPDSACTVLATRLTLRSRRDAPRLLLWTFCVRDQLTRSPGLIGHAMALQVGHKALWTVSAWSHRADLARFDSSGAHAAAKRKLGPHLLPSTLAVWRCAAADLPVSWKDVRSRVADAGARPGEIAGATSRPVAARWPAEQPRPGSQEPLP